MKRNQRSSKRNHLRDLIVSAKREPSNCRLKRAKLNPVVDDSEESMTTTIPDFVTNLSSKPSKGKERDDAVPPKVPRTQTHETGSSSVTLSD